MTVKVIKGFVLILLNTSLLLSQDVDSTHIKNFSLFFGPNINKLGTVQTIEFVYQSNFKSFKFLNLSTHFPLFYDISIITWWKKFDNISIRDYAASFTIKYPFYKLNEKIWFSFGNGPILHILNSTLKTSGGEKFSNSDIKLGTNFIVESHYQWRKRLKIVFKT